MSASGVSLSFHPMSHHPLTLAAGLFFVCLWSLCLLFGFWCLLPVLQVSWDFIIPPRVLNLDDRQGFTARSATQQKKKLLPILPSVLHQLADRFFPTPVVPWILQLHSAPQCCQYRSHEVPWPGQYKEDGCHPFYKSRASHLRLTSSKSSPV